MKRFIRTLFLLTALAVGSAHAQAAPPLLEPVGVEFNAVKAVKGEICKITPCEGSVVPYVEEFFFEQEGTIDVMHVVIGQSVKAGDPLITLNTEAQQERAEELERQLDQIRTNGLYDDALWQIDLDMLHVELDRLLHTAPGEEAAAALKRLEIEEKQLTIRLEQDLRSLELDRLESEYQLLQDEISGNVLYAPFDGRVMYMSDQLQHGSYVSAYTPLIYLADDNRLFVESGYIANSTISSAHDVYALVGDKRHSITPVPYDVREYMAMMLSGETLKLTFSFNEADADVKAGDYAVVCMVHDYREDALLVPASALYADDASYLYVIENGVRVRRDVKTGIRTDWQIQILEGLEEGELVYVPE